VRPRWRRGGFILLLAAAIPRVAGAQQLPSQQDYFTPGGPHPEMPQGSVKEQIARQRARDDAANPGRPKFIWGCTDPGTEVLWTDELRLEAKHPEAAATVNPSLAKAAIEGCKRIETSTMGGRLLRVSTSPAIPWGNEDMTVAEVDLTGTPGLVWPSTLLWFRYDDFKAALGGH
jgi:hypothetical protein